MTSIAIAVPTQKKKWTTTGKIMFTGWIFFLIAMIVPVALHTPIYSNVILFPMANTKSPPVIKGVQGEECTFTNDVGNKLNGWLYRVPGATKICIVHHGNAGNITNRLPLAELYATMGASTFLYDYRSFGKSEGEPLLRTLVTDGICAFDYVHNKLGFAPKDILHHGESIGSGVACAVATARPSGGLILQSAIGSLPSVGRAHFPFLAPYPDVFFPDPTLNNVEQIKSVHAPVLLVHGDADQTVPWQHSQAIYDNAPGHKKLVIFHGYGHNAIDPTNQEAIGTLKAIIAGTF